MRHVIGSRRSGGSGISRARLTRSVAVLAAALAAAALQPPPAAAQPAPELRNDKIKVDYYEPRNQALMPLYERLQRRRVLEELSQFLAAVRWPKTLRLIAKECPPNTPRPEVYYSGYERSLTFCYQMFTFLRSLRPPPAFGTQQETIVGGLMGVALHASARAAFDMLNVPRLGDDGDAADQLSAFLALQFGDDVARVVTKGTYFVWKRYDDEIISNDRLYNYASRSSVPRQRMINTLCIAYGGAPALFKNFVDQGDLLSSRAETCADEYQVVLHAFQKTMLPHIDDEMMKRARSTRWIAEDDLK
jgi:putative metallopeptidase DUF4344